MAEQNDCNYGDPAYRFSLSGNNQVPHVTGTG